MRVMLAFGMVGFAPLAVGAAQVTPSPYVGEEHRVIKALSEEEIEAYRTGSGMALAKAAELNHYPGPRHVLELVDELALSAAQHSAVRRVFEEMQGRARRVGDQIVARERRLDEFFAQQRADGVSVRELVGEIATLQGELRWIHLEAHLRTKEILSAAQTAHYDELRGYAAPHVEHHR